MALRVLIVDDDTLIRTNLKTIVEWERNGYVICGEAANGSNAIALLNKCQPDIVITDMNMPVMDGVALIEYLQENKPYIKIIALSGYDDFNYVRQSMKKGAVDYILKHKLTGELLLEVLKTARQSIQNEKRARDVKQFEQEKLASASDILRHSFVSRLIGGEFNDGESILTELQYTDIEIEMKNLIVVAAEIDDFSLIEEKYSPKDMQRLIKTLIDLCRNILKESGKGFIEHIEGGDFVIIFSFGYAASTLFVSNRVVNDISRIKTTLKRYLNITASFGVSKLFPSIVDISKAYFEAKQLLKDKFYMGKDKVFTNEPIKTEPEKKFSLELKEEKKIIQLTKFCKRDELKDFISEFFGEMKKRNVSYHYVQIITAELVNIISRIAREMGIDSAGLFLEKEMPHNVMLKYDTFNDVKQWIFNIFDRLVCAIESKDIKKHYSEITVRAIKYIGKNYNTSFSLNDAATFSGVSSTYLCRVFKEETGKGFIEYINTYRIEKAKTLIQGGNILIKEIYSDLGFNNYNYFFKVFKEYVGMTPAEYEESINK